MQLHEAVEKWITRREINLAPSTISGYRRTDALDRAIKLAGVPRVTPHGLRHSMASAAAAKGIDIKTTQQIMGHAHYTTTADIYTHVDQSAGREAAKNIAVALIPARLEIA